MARVEEKGGMVAAIESGWVQGQIGDAAYRFQQAVEKKERIVVGVNAFAESETHPPALKLDPAVERDQVERLRSLREKRNSPAWQSALNAVDDAARSGSNLMEPTLLAVRSLATVGEIVAVLKRTFGTFEAS